MNIANLDFFLSLREFYNDSTPHLKKSRISILKRGLKLKKESKHSSAMLYSKQLFVWNLSQCFTLCVHKKECRKKDLILLRLFNSFREIFANYPRMFFFTLKLFYERFIPLHKIFLKGNLFTILKTFFQLNVSFPSSVNPTKWSVTLKQFVGCCRQLIWVSLTILWSWRLKG